jgi:hypothetical protein
MKQVESITAAFRLRLVVFLYDIFLDPEDGGRVFLGNFGELPLDYTALCFRRYYY